jgi:hypothetical protein
MKTPSRGTFIRLVLAVIVVGSAYLLGHRRTDAQPGAVVTTPKHAQNAPASAVAATSAVPATSAPEPISAARQQEWAQLKAELANPEKFPQSLYNLLSQIARTDPEALPFLLEQIATLPPGNVRDAGMEQLFRLLGNHDPSKALSMVGLIDPNKRDGMTNMLLADLAKGDPNLAMAALANLPDGPQVQSAYRSVFLAWAKVNGNGPAAAAAAFALPPGADRTQALTGVVDGWIGRNANPDLSVTQAALDWASGLPPADSNVVLNNALNAVVKQDPALAAQYVDKLTDASVRNKAIQSLARSWAVPVSPQEIQHQDPSAALDWLNQVATGETYDTNVEYIFSKLNPATAAPLVNKVTEPGVRETVITTVANALGKTDPQAALTWLQTLPTSDSATRDPIIQKLSQPASGNARP